MEKRAKIENSQNGTFEPVHEIQKKNSVLFLIKTNPGFWF